MPNATIFVKFYQYYGTRGSLSRFVEELVPAVSEMMPAARFVYAMPRVPHAMASKDRHLSVGFSLDGSRVGNVLRLLKSEASLWARIQKLARSGSNVLLWELGQWLVSPWMGERTLTTVCDLIQLSQPRNRRTLLYYSYCGMPLLRRKRLCVAISEHVRKQLTTRGVERTDHVPCFVSDVFYETGRRSSCAPDAPYLFVGTLAPHKNLSLLLRFYEQGFTRRRLLCVVPEFHQSALREELERRHLVDRVNVLCQLHDSEIRELYTQAFALICPSLDEGFGMPVAEAMTSGLPVAASDIEVMREVCGDAAVYFDPTSLDGLGTALGGLEEKEQRRAFIDAGRTRSQAFKLTSVAEAYRNLVEGLL